jgi:tRNA(Ile)-lysidine synthase
MNNRNADCIAVAHHRDDQAETLLLNILRGTGLRGLAGMHPRNNDIIRPLLCLSRNDILLYLKECNQDYVTDSTNLMSIAQRNHIRLNIIPLLQSLNPAAVEHLCTAA